MIQERRDRLDVQIVPVEPAGLLAGPLLGKNDQHPERVPIRGDGAWTGLTLTDEAVGEEALQRGGNQAHRTITPWDSSSRPAASANSSGAADRYQYVDRGSRWPR